MSSSRRRLARVIDHAGIERKLTWSKPTMTMLQKQALLCLKKCSLIVTPSHRRCKGRSAFTRSSNTNTNFNPFDAQMMMMHRISTGKRERAWCSQVDWSRKKNILAPHFLPESYNPCWSESMHSKPRRGQKSMSTQQISWQTIFKNEFLFSTLTWPLEKSFF